MDISDVPETWPVASSAETYRGRLVSVRTDKVRMPDNHLAEREVVIHPGAVGVLALDDADRVLMIRQYRHPVGHLLWEIPAGLCDVAGETPWATAQRELAEEAAYRAIHWRILADYFTSPGFSTERLRVFLARGLEPIPAAVGGYRIVVGQVILLRAGAFTLFAPDAHGCVVQQGFTHGDCSSPLLGRGFRSSEMR